MGTHRFERESTESASLKSGTLNFWKMEGAQKVTFSIQNLYSQMHFRSQMCPGGHLEGFELSTRARNLFVFQREIKDLHDNLYKMNCFLREIKDLNDNLKKIIDYSKENQRFPR